MSSFDDIGVAMIPSGYKEDKLYSVLPNSGDGDFDFSRSTTATRVNSEGLIETARTNFLLQSNNFDTTWTTTNASVTGGQSGYDGTNNAWLLNESAVGGRVLQSISGSGVMTMSLYAKSGTLDFILVYINTTGTDPFAYFDLTNGDVSTSGASSRISASAVAVGDGWYRLSVTGNVGTLSSIEIYPANSLSSHTASAGSIYIQDAQLEQGLVATDYIETTASSVTVGIVNDLPRLDYSGGVSCPALLLEPQSTNKVTQSETFSTWTRIFALLTSTNISAPDGSNSVIKMSSSDLAVREHKVIIHTNTIPATDSIFAKMGEVRYIMNRRNSSNLSWQSVVFDLQEGVVAANNYSSNAYPKITHYGNGWYRCEVYYPSVSNGETGWGLSDGIDEIYTPTNTTDGLYIWGAQQEDLSYATSYIPTEGTSVTRNADVCNNSGNADLFNDSEGVLFAEIAALADDLTFRSISISSDAGYANSIMIRYISTSNQVNVITRIGSALNNTSVDVNDITEFNKIAFKYKSEDCALFINGVKVATPTQAFSSSGINDLSFDRGDGNAPFYGKTKQLIVFDETLSDYELAELTSLVNLNPFTFTVQTNTSGVSNNDQFTLPLTDNGTVDIMVFWGDGTSDAITAFDQAEKTHTYPSAGTYEIKITGTLQGFRFDNGGDKFKMLDIKKWGIFDINVSKAFRNCSNLTQSATDVPIISTTSLNATFQVAPKFNGNVSNWDVSSVTNFNFVFNRARLFNQDISSWDVSSATNLTGMFKEANIFNQDISGWDVSNNGNFKEMFRQARDFNQPIGSWTIKNVVNQNINMQRMFRQATSFDQSLANWDMEKVNNLAEFLLDAGLSTANYDATLIGWAAQNVQSGLTCDFGNSQYTAGGAAEAARNTLINTYGWTITDGGAA